MLLFTNRLRWGECDSEHKAIEERLLLADYVAIEADLKDHIFALEQVLRISDAVARGRYLEDCQRCHWPEHTCEYQCTAADEHCDSFDERPPHAAILDWLEDCRPLRPIVKEWIAAQASMHQTMREGVRQFFPELKPYQLGEDAEGNTVMADMTPGDQAAYDAAQDRAHESMAQRIDQYALNLGRIRTICQQQGSLQEVAALITDGLPPQVKGPVSLS